MNILIGLWIISTLFLIACFAYWLLSERYEIICLDNGYFMYSRKFLGRHEGYKRAKIIEYGGIEYIQDRETKTMYRNSKLLEAYKRKQELQVNG